MSGNNVIGKEKREINPNKSIMIDTTVDKTGLSINLFIISKLVYLSGFCLIIFWFVQQRESCPERPSS